MLDKTFFAAAIAAVATGYVVSGVAKAEEPGQSDLMELIREDLDANQKAYTIALVANAGNRFAARSAKIENVLGPIPANTELLAANASADSGAKIESVAVASADAAIAKKVANMEDPFEPRLPLAPAIITFVQDEQ